MNKTVSESISFVRSLEPLLSDVGDKEIGIAPPFTSLYSLSEVLHGIGLKLCAQNVFYEEKGAFTGEISAPMLKEVGCDYVIVGHSERRRYFFETDEIINKKIKICQKFSLGVILCIGETLEQREKGETFLVLESQLKNSLLGVDPFSIVVAYEPVWAIGTGKNATPEQAEEAHLFIKERLFEIFGDDSSSLRIIYGGSVTPKNIGALMSKPSVFGVLVGGASLDPQSFAAIINYNKI